MRARSSPGACEAREACEACEGLHTESMVGRVEPDGAGVHTTAVPLALCAAVRGVPDGCTRRVVCAGPA